MRRGQNNKWTYDLSPQSDGVVSVSRNGSTKHFQTVQELSEDRARPSNKEERALARLKKLGYVA